MNLNLVPLNNFNYKQCKINNNEYKSQKITFSGDLFKYDKSYSNSENKKNKPISLFKGIKEKFANIFNIKTNNNISTFEDVDNISTKDVEERYASIFGKRRWKSFNISIDEQNKKVFNSIADVLEEDDYCYKYSLYSSYALANLSKIKNNISENAEVINNIITAKDEDGKRRLSQETILDFVLDKRMNKQSWNALNNAMTLKNDNKFRYSGNDLKIMLGEGELKRSFEKYKTPDDSTVRYRISTRIEDDVDVFVASQKEVSDSNGKLVFKDEYRSSELEGKFDIIRTDSNGKKTTVGLASYSVNGKLSIVEKTLFGLDSTKTDYLYVEDEKSRLNYYKITDKNGNILLENKISYKKIDENHYESDENGIKYNIEYKPDKIIVKNSLGNTCNINIIKKSLLDSLGNSTKFGISEEMLPVVKKLNGSDLMSIGNLGLKSITLSKDSQHRDNALYNHYMNRIFVSPKYKDNLFILDHELGHFIDYTKDIHSNPDLQETYYNELDDFIKNASIIEFDQMSYFTSLSEDKRLGGLCEMIAEVHAINNSSNTEPLLSARGEFLQVYFPKTFAKITKDLNEAKLSKSPLPNEYLDNDEIIKH